MNEQIRLALIIVAIIVIIMLLSLIVIRNNIITKKKKVKYNWSIIDIELKRKAEIIPNLVTILKSHAKYEQSTLTKMLEVRNNLSSMDINKQIAANNEFGMVFKIVKEDYPKLKAHESFVKLFDEIKEIEKQIAYQRHFYNEMVMAYNRYIERFPNNIVASIFNYSSVIYLKFDEELE